MNGRECRLAKKICPVARSSANLTRLADRIETSIPALVANTPRHRALRRCGTSGWLQLIDREAFKLGPALLPGGRVLYRAILAIRVDHPAMRAARCLAGYPHTGYLALAKAAVEDGLEQPIARVPIGLRLTLYGHVIRLGLLHVLPQISTRWGWSAGGM